MADLNLEALYEDHATALFGFLLNVTRNPEDARDLLQEVFLRVSRQPHRIREARQPRAYLLRIAWNTHHDEFRRRKAARRRQRQYASDVQPAIYRTTEDPDAEAFRSALSEAMESLPPEQRAVVHLRAWEELTFEQIGDSLEISPNTASSRYRYAMEKLRARLRPLYLEL